MAFLLILKTATAAEVPDIIKLARIRMEGRRRTNSISERIRERGILVGCLGDQF